MMEAASPAGPTGSRDRGFSDTFTTRPRVFNDRDPMRHRSSPAGRENRSPSSVPKGLETMLKTTTETGDIGMFSIKPSRLPQSLNTPRRMGPGLNELGMQKTRQAFQPYGVPIVDDRRRLPSYARDNSSDVLSMYETASQKSASRPFDDPDYRSYSMTQTSYSSYTLSNHRSYTSLRSQHDGNGLVQRPRSPFAYPTRLRRPGFRPSSPALTDGGVVDYSRRVEIDRAPYGSGRNTSSPSSLYAQKRRPPLSLRHEANRSTPSLLSQSSPPRRSSSPLVPRPNGFSGNDWQRRNATASGSTSPARSTLSLTSTVNLYTTVPVPSAITTPGKLHPPSPLYYDYTEDFEVETCSQPVAMAPPPQFRIEKTIPEDRPMSAEGPTMKGLPKMFPDGHTGFQILNPTSSEPLGGNMTPGAKANTPDMSNYEEPCLSAENIDSGENTTKGAPDTSVNKKVIRLSGLGYGARELSCHVEEAFGLPSSASFVIDLSKTNNEDHISPGTEEHFERDKDPQSTRTSLNSLGSQFSKFPSPPGAQGQAKPNGNRDSHGEPTQETIKTYTIDHNGRQSGELSRGQIQKESFRRTSRESQCLPPSGLARTRFSDCNSMNTSQNEPTDSIEKTSQLQDSRQSKLSFPPRSSSMTSPTIPEKVTLRSVPKEESRTPLVSSFNQQRGKELRMLAQRQPLTRNKVRRADPLGIAVQDAKDVPNFSHQIPHKTVARSGSPMLAPKPISPARQLKLKNSIPQLMKALPPIPPEPSLVMLVPDHEDSKTEELPCLLPPSIAEITGTFLSEASKGKRAPPNSESKLPALPEDFDELSAAPGTMPNQKSKDKAEQNTTRYPVPKLKLKVQSSTALRAISSPNSHPLNFEESHPCVDQDSGVRLQSKLPSEQPSTSRQPKFKLRVIRASDSTQGTVRVTRDSENGDSGGGGISIQNPKDLFTPTPGFDSIFRHFGKHLHSRKTSANSDYHSEESEPMFMPTNTSSPVSEAQTRDRAHLRGPMLGKMGLFEARSVFSDDSSQVQGHHGLRKRISNLRAKIATPYTGKAGSQSCDDITWKDRHNTQILAPPTNQSESNLHGNGKSSDIKPMRRLVEKLHRQRLKAKVQSWIQGARSVIARVRPRHSKAGSGSGDGGKLEG